MNKLIEKFPTWSEEELETSWNNALKYVVEGKEGGHSSEKIAEAKTINTYLNLLPSTARVALLT